MDRLAFAILVIVGLINLFPVIGITSPEVLIRLYDIDALDGDLLILMRHRALLFGIIGAFIGYSAFVHHLRPAAIVIGLASMLGFTVLAFTAGELGEKLYNVAIIDALASLALGIVAMNHLRKVNSKRSRSIDK